jgi:mannose/fructose-specific phosphotransferase system component IIA
MADMQINPNPVNEQMTVAIEAEASEKATIVITDLSGKRVYNGAAAVASGLNNVRIPVNNLAKGTYVVRVMLNGQTMIKKINKL